VDRNAHILVAGHRGLVGSAIVRALSADGYRHVITRSHREVDLTRQSEVDLLFDTTMPEYVFLCAARVGGIQANNIYRAEFIYENLAIQTHVIHAAYRFGVKRLLFLGSSCVYPRDCPQPMREEYLLTGPLESTNEPYAVAKIAGIRMCESYNQQYGCQFIPVMPTNLYGSHDNFDLEESHVLPALIRKVHEAKITNREHVVVWGSGQPLREFLHVDDLANACIFLMNRTHPTSLINIGSGVEMSIRDLAELVSLVVGYHGDLEFDADKPDGMRRKLLDVSRMNELGWKPSVTLSEGIADTYRWYCHQNAA